MYRFAKILLTAGLLIPSAGSADPLVLKDPTRPHSPTAAVPTSAPGTATYRVTAVFVSADRRVAVVNERLVAVGDRIDGARVAAILDDGVRLALADGARTVHLRRARVRDY